MLRPQALTTQRNVQGSLSPCTASPALSPHQTSAWPRRNSSRRPTNCMQQLGSAGVGRGCTAPHKHTLWQLAGQRLPVLLLPSSSGERLEETAHRRFRRGVVAASSAEGDGADVPDVSSIAAAASPQSAAHHQKFVDSDRLPARYHIHWVRTILLVLEHAQWIHR